MILRARSLTYSRRVSGAEKREGGVRWTSG